MMMTFAVSAAHAAGSVRMIPAQVGGKIAIQPTVTSGQTTIAARIAAPVAAGKPKAAGGGAAARTPSVRTIMLKSMALPGAGSYSPGAGNFATVDQLNEVEDRLDKKIDAAYATDEMTAAIADAVEKRVMDNLPDDIVTKSNLAGNLPAGLATETYVAGAIDAAVGDIQKSLSAITGE